MLVNKTEYLTAGVHIGMKTCTPYMKQFVYKIREDGLAVFNIKKVDERIKTAAYFFSQFNKPLVVTRKDNAFKALKTFGDAVDAKVITGRFHPGTLTNPAFKEFYEPDAVLVVDPLVDEQVIKEARKKRIPVIALCDTFNEVKNIDFIIPVNNNGKKALAIVFWIFTKEVLRNKKKIKKDADFKLKIKDFGDEDESKITKKSSSKDTEVRRIQSKGKKRQKG